MITITDIVEANEYVENNKHKVICVEYRGTEVVVYEEGDTVPDFGVHA